MSTQFDNWINFNLKTSAAFDRGEEVEAGARKRLAEQMQRNIRTSVDPGIDRKGATTAEAIKVRAEDGRFVIYAESHADVLRATSKQVSQEAQGVEDLFRQSSGVPSIRKNRDGSTSLDFKSIELDKLFQEQREQQQQHSIEQAVTQTIRTGIVNAYEEAFDEVERKHPEGT